MTGWKLTADDRLEIQELYARYAWGIDLADEELALSTFVQDAWFDHLWQGRVHGHEAIRENLRSLWNDRQHWWYGRQHIMDNFLYEPRETPGEVDMRCFFQILQFSVDYRTNFVFGIGTRKDHVTKKEGVWRFQSLEVNAWTEKDQVPWRGEDRIAGRPKYTPKSPPMD
ncbi:MAG: nuclear transport factor 2 family protein [Pseudoclavibacter sp.]